MTQTAAILLVAVACALIAAVLERTVERTPRKRVRTIIRSEHDLRIIGDGAWVTASPSPRSARVRDIEPRGC